MLINGFGIFLLQRAIDSSEVSSDDLEDVSEASSTGGYTKMCVLPKRDAGKDKEYTVYSEKAGLCKKLCIQYRSSFIDPVLLQEEA